MMNKVILIGRLVRDPELRYTGSGTPVSNFSLAVERNYTNQQGERDVDFINIVCWRKLAETCAHHLGKGRLVAVEGRLQIRKSQSEKNDRTYINPEVVARDVRFLDWPDDENRGGNFQKDHDKSPPPSPEKGQQKQAEDVDDEFDVPF